MTSVTKVVNLHALADAALPLNSTSPSAYTEAFNATLAHLAGQGLVVKSVFSRPYGRSSYFFAIVEQQVEPESPAAKRSAKRSAKPE